MAGPPATETRPSGEPIFDFALSLRFTSRSFDLVDSATSTTVLHFGTETPYLGVGGSVALFPFRDAPPALQGLGILGGASIGFLNSTFSDSSGQSTSFGSQDLRADLDLTYRLKLPVFGEAMSLYDPSIAAQLGYALFHFSVDPQNPADLQPINRSALKLGLDYLQPVAHWMRLDFGGSYYVSPTPGAAETSVYGSAQSSGFGLSLSAGGSFGATIAPGLGYLVALDYIAFSDHYAGTGGGGSGINQGDETYVDLWLGLTYGF